MSDPRVNPTGPSNATDGAVTEPGTRGYLVEFETSKALLDAASKVRDAEFTRWDAHTPFPVHGLDQAMGVKPTLLPWFVFLCGAGGALAGLGLQWFTNAVDYPFLISGKPFFSVPANIPVMFETTVLGGAFGAFLGMLAAGRLPRFYHPVFASERFRRASADRFFISVEAEDPKFDLTRTKEFLETLGGTCVEALEDPVDA